MQLQTKRLTRKNQFSQKKPALGSKYIDIFVQNHLKEKPQPFNIPQIDSWLCLICIALQDAIK